MVRTMARCIICDQRPSRKRGICAQCYGHIEHERQARVKPQPLYYLTYRGNVVGLYPDGDGMLKARLETRSAEGLPKSKVIDLNGWCEGYDRDTIKNFKRAVLSLAHA